MDNLQQEPGEYMETQCDAAVESVPSSNKYYSQPTEPLQKWDRFKTMINSKNLHYDMSKDKIAIIFNHENCKGYDRRRGTQYDVERLETSFKKLNFKVKVNDDLIVNDIKFVMNKVASLDPSKTSCVAVIVLTHGLSGTLMARDKKYDISCLWDGLIGKLPGVPKLFFIQACRGEKKDMGMEVTDSVVELDLQDSYRIPTTADFLKMYSSVDGYVSLRDKIGSWFIQTLCNVLDDLSEEYDLLHLLTIVCTAVAYNFETNTDDKSKEMPQIESTLTKFLKFEKVKISEK